MFIRLRNVEYGQIFQVAATFQPEVTRTEPLCLLLNCPVDLVRYGKENGYLGLGYTVSGSGGITRVIKANPN